MAKAQFNAALGPAGMILLLTGLFLVLIGCKVVGVDKITLRSHKKKRGFAVFALTLAVPCFLGTRRLPPVVGSNPVERRVLGISTRGHPIEAYRIGHGPLGLAFIGGIHGGYEWNTILLAYEAIDFFASHAQELPESISLYIVPAANPDGQVAVVGRTGRFSPDVVTSNTITDTAPGRLNGNWVDLNRNWGYKWTSTGFWGEDEVSGGTAPFSEIETQILRDFLTDPPMAAVVFWHSAAHGVFPGSCDTPRPQASDLAMIYAEAAQYPLYESFDNYPVTGDATDWLCSQGIPAIVVELSSHGDLDWRQNLAGTWAVINSFSEPGVAPNSGPDPCPLIKPQTRR